MASKDRKCLVTYVSRATWELNWVHGEFTRAPAHVSSRAAPERMNSLFYTGSSSGGLTRLMFVLLVLVAHLARTRQCRAS